MDVFQARRCAGALIEVALVEAADDRRGELFSRPRHDRRLRHRHGARYPLGLLTRAGAAVSSAFAGNVTEDQYGGAQRGSGRGQEGLTELIRPAETRTPPKEIEAFRREFGELQEGLGNALVVFIANLDR
jgi:hypothetical protein